MTFKSEQIIDVLILYCVIVTKTIKLKQLLSFYLMFQLQRDVQRDVH